MTRKNRSKYASKKYPNLYRFPDSPFWVFRKYSSEKGEEFKFSTGEDKNEALAYKLGSDKFREWLGSYLDGSSRRIQIKDVARSVLSAKEGKAIRTVRSSKNQIVNHLIPAFGHLLPNQMTSLKWESYIASERGAGRNRKFFNLRKALIEVMRKSYEEKLIERIPKFTNPDPDPEPPTYLNRETVRSILKHASPGTKLLAFIVWKQGARPGEVIQYRFSMIRWKDGPHGSIHIPGEITKTRRPRQVPLNSRVARVLKWLEKRTSNDLLFPSPKDPEKPIQEYKTGWNSACARAQVSATIYNLRDSFVTDCLLRGESSTFIAKYLDSSTEMIDRKYAVATKKALQGVAN